MMQTLTPESPDLTEDQPRPNRPLLGQRLVSAGIITPEELHSALGQQAAKNLRLGEALVEMGFLSAEELLPYLAEQLDIQHVRLRDGLVDPLAVRLIPRRQAETLEALALLRVRDTLTVAMTEPQNLRRLDELERISGYRIRPVLALRASIQELLRRAYDDDFAVDAVTADMDREAVELQTEAIHVELDSFESMADGSPIVNLVNYMIVHAVRQGASDIHIEPGHKHSTVRFRVDGQLREVLRPRKDYHPALVSRVKVMAKLDIAEHRAPQDGRIHVFLESREIDLRVSSLPRVLGEKIVLRVLDRRNVKFNLDDLGLPEQQLGIFKDMLAKPYGLLLVTGPTGSGKTTTLYSAIELIKSVHRNIVTVEDPVEYQLELVNQVQVGVSKSLTFAGALRSILRQDPDVIMVGEIRDRETAEVAIQAALTGHLVLSTLHTNDSPSAVARLVDMGVAPFKISAALVGVVAQRLVRNVCPDCLMHYFPSSDFLDMIHYQGDKRRQFVRGEGCPKCYDTGFKRRTGVYEILKVTADLRELINQDASLEALREAHKSQGGTSLLEEGIRLAEASKTSLEEVARVAFFD
jgi:type IV pilus assembly protein PilB